MTSICPIILMFSFSSKTFQARPLSWNVSIKEMTGLLFSVVHRALTGPLRIQPWSQDRRKEPNQIKPGIWSEKKSREIGQENTHTHTEETNRRRPDNTRRTRKKNSSLSRLRKKGSPISSGIEPRQEDKGKDKE